MRFITILKKNGLLVLLFFVFSVYSNAQQIQIDWKKHCPVHFYHYGTINMPFFTQVVYGDSLPFKPFFTTLLPVSSDFMEVDVQLENVQVIEVDSGEVAACPIYSQILNTAFELDYHIQYSMKKPSVYITIFPIRINNLTGKFEKLSTANIIIDEKPSADFLLRNMQEQKFADNSKLASGNWYKIKVTQTGVHKLTPSDFAAMGLTVSDPRKIKIYGMGAGMLPEQNNYFRYDDLPENAIYVAGEEDGSFDANDYVLFYGQGPVKFQYTSINGIKMFYRNANYYSDAVYYFVTTDGDAGKRILTQASSPLLPTHIVNSFVDFQYHEKDEHNLAQAGKVWYGEVLNEQNTSFSTSFNFPNIITTKPVTLFANFAAFARSDSKIKMTMDGNVFYSSPITPVSNDQSPANPASIIQQFNPGTNNLSVNIEYNYSGATAWIDFINVNVYRPLTVAGSQMLFRDAESYGSGKVAQFEIANASAAHLIWDVTVPVNVVRQDFALNGTTAVFVNESDSLHEYIIFDGSNFLKPDLVGGVANQNLHGLGQQDLIIVAHPDFFSQAERLAEHHRQQDNLRTVVVAPQTIYNEFSSGSQDVSAIRDFVRMFYVRAGNTDDLPKYLLLFGDASFDYKNRESNNTNFIPTYHESYSLNYSTYVTDDFFGLLDSWEGAPESGKVDIGIGRLPVVTAKEAEEMVDKIINYASKKSLVSINPNQPNVVSNLGDWRNTLCLIADDADQGWETSFVYYSETIANFFDTAAKNVFLDKIYLDAYVQESFPGGQRYPDVRAAINNRIKKGALLINYIGHGGELGWAHERIVEISDINAWSNKYNSTFFITQTCEFSRFDDPERVSAGELTLLNPNGGVMGLFSAARVTYASPNYEVAIHFLKNMFQKNNGKYNRIGDLVRIAKNGYTSESTLPFALLGDPALSFAYPQYNIVTTHINNAAIDTVLDTIMALEKITIKGKVVDESGALVPDFNGTLYPTIFDKPSYLTTLGNDGFGTQTFRLMKNIIFKGKASVVNGEFEFSFVVPRDIAFNVDKGKIIYYAENGNIDANGYFEDFIVSGVSSNFEEDNAGPDIQLFINDTKFRSGDLTDENPSLIAFLSDLHGINTTGNGIGHDIIGIIDDDYANPHILNDFYSSDINDYQKGQLFYPFYNLSDGQHKLTVKAWDVYNNSNQASIGFIVASSEQMLLKQFFAYPNPFNDKTYFSFQHNQSSKNLDIEIQIFDITGKKVKTILAETQSFGYTNNSLMWDGKGDSGNPLPAGIYIYRFIVKLDDKEILQSHDYSDKLVIIR